MKGKTLELMNEKLVLSVIINLSMSGDIQC